MMPTAMGMTVTKRTRRVAALALAALAGAGAALPAPASAQDLPAPGDGFAWERVGDVPVDPYGLAFGPDSTLWAAGGDGLYRLDLSGGFPGEWVRVIQGGLFDGRLIVLGKDAFGRDTLVTSIGGATRRSVDGGRTWETVYHRGGGGLFEFPAGYPYAGRILTGASDGFARAVAYSDDRGGSFTEGVMPDDGQGNYADARDFAVLPPGSSDPGRILAAGMAGVSVSDDGGATFRKSGLWQYLYYIGEAIDAVEHPGPASPSEPAQERGTIGVDAVMGGDINAQPLARAWVSTDAGETWGPDGGGHRLPEGPPNGGGGVEAVLSLGGSSVLVVLSLGTIYQSDDAGETWKAVGRVAEINENRFVLSALLDPERRLYVGLHAQGIERGWVWRTAEQLTVPVPSEPGPEPEEEPLGVEVHPNPFRGTATVTLTLARPSEVEAALYDVLGRRVLTLASGLLPAGRHELALERGDLPAGVYVVRAAAGGAFASRTVTLLR